MSEKLKNWTHQRTFCLKKSQWSSRKQLWQQRSKTFNEKQSSSPCPKMKFFWSFWDEIFLVKMLHWTLRQQAWHLIENFLPDEQKLSIAQFPKRYGRKIISNNFFFLKLFPWTRRQPFLQHARESMGGSRKRVISVLEVVQQTMNIKNY